MRTVPPRADSPTSMVDSGPTPSALHSIGRSTVILMAGSLCLLLFTSLGRVVVARVVTVPEWGDYNLGLTLTGLLSVVSLLGLNNAIARSISYHRDPQVRRRLVLAGLAVATSAAVVGSLGVYLLATPLATVFDRQSPSLLAEVLRLFSVTIGTQLLSSYLASIFQGLENPVPSAVFNQILAPALFAGFVGLFLVLRWQFTGTLIAYTASNAVALAGLGAYAAHRLPSRIPAGAGPPDDGSVELWPLTIAFWGVGAFQFVTAFADTLILGLYRPPSVVGEYSAAMLLARLFTVGTGGLAFIFLPVTARLSQAGSLATVRESYVTATRWVLALTVPLFLLFVADPALSLTAVFGPGYSAAGPSLEWLAVGSLVFVTLGPVQACLAGLGTTRTLLATTTVSALVNIGLCFALIPGEGLLGASIAWSIARIAFAALGAVALSVFFQIGSWGRRVFLPLGLAVGTGLPLFWFIGQWHPPDWSVAALYLLGLALFLAAVAGTRGFSRGDLALVELAERAIGRALPPIRRFVLAFGGNEPIPLARG
jgi:O-antigen/teichoic acid export membrane protein